MSLALSGALTGYLVQRLQYSAAQDQLEKNVLLLRQPIQQWACVRRVANRCATSNDELLAELDSNLPSLNLGPGQRLILLDRPPAVPRAAPRQAHVVYDSGHSLVGTAIPLGRERLISGVRVRSGTATLEGEEYFVAAAQVPATVSAVSFIVLARARADVAAQATRDLIPPILQAGAAGLLIAMLVTVLLGRAFTRPLGELQRAAEDIAGGNYARRVRITGRDEMGVVGRAFNRMAEAVERSRHQQRAFLANVSHELKTPLTSLIGFSQALMDGSLRTVEEKARAATILHEEAQRVLRMSQELLDLARVEAGELALNPHPVDLGVQLRQEIEIVRKRAETRRLALRLTVPAALPPVQADPDRLHQILENLLDNAVKYAPEGTTVWISAEDQAGPSGGRRITTAVRNRVGVRAPDPERMFDRFYRGDPSRSSMGGVGLGLAISRELAIAQNGDLRAELRADGSLCIELDLPAAQPPASVHTPSRGPVRLSPRPQPDL